MAMRVVDPGTQEASQEDQREFKGNLGYKKYFRTVWATKAKTCFQNKKTNGRISQTRDNPPMYSHTGQKNLLCVAWIWAC